VLSAFVFEVVGTFLLLVLLEGLRPKGSIGDAEIARGEGGRDTSAAFPYPLA
jgi:hypothetical protein